MPIPVQTIVDRVASRLDAENSQRYLFNQDYKPAINGAQEWIVTALNPEFSSKKFSTEGLRELTFTQVWQTNKYSRVSFDSTKMKGPLWTIIGVYAKIKTDRAAGASPQADPAKSVLRDDIAYISSDESAQRLTAEEWNINSKNVFEAGNNILKNELSFYGYRDFSDYTSKNYSGATGFREIQIRPDVPNELVAVEYIKYPKQVATINDTLEFPESMTEFIVEKALNFVAWKIGDQTNMFGISELETKRLLALIAQ